MNVTSCDMKRLGANNCDNIKRVYISKLFYLVSEIARFKQILHYKETLFC